MVNGVLQFVSSVANEEAMELEPEKRTTKEDNGRRREVAKFAEINPAILEAEGEVELEEETVREVMKWLEDEMDYAPFPHSQSSPSYCQETNFVTINGNEERCGPSFSSSASTVMASVDTRGGVFGMPYFIGCLSDRAERPSTAPWMWTPAFFPVMAEEDGCSNATGDGMECLARALGAGGSAL